LRPDVRDAKAVYVHDYVYVYVHDDVHVHVYDYASCAIQKNLFPLSPDRNVGTGYSFTGVRLV
jgi:hypothetical protein